MSTDSIGWLKNKAKERDLKDTFDPKFHKCVGKETGETNHVERLFYTIRQWLQRVLRKTLAFSKVLYMYHIIFKVFFVTYNEYVSGET